MAVRAAIYARRSTDEHQAASIDVQLEEARRYIEAQGWSIDDVHVFVEDAVSRAEFKKRPALIKLLNAAKARSFDVVVTRDETRLGGDVNRTGLVIQDLLESGVELYYYFTDEQVRLDSATDKIMVALRNFSAELEREKISQRTREHLMTKARRGLNTGGRVFGYDNVRFDRGVDFRINEAQAAVVRDIFARYARGEGFTQIAKDLNAARVASPAAGKRGSGSWAPSQIHSMLKNERYVGVVSWGEYKKGYKGGTKVREKQSASGLLIVERPDLRIIDHQTWEAVASRLLHRTRPNMRATRGTRARNLLTGYARCGVCGGPMQIEKGKHGKSLVRVYSCLWARKRGEAVCTNKMRRPADPINDAVIEWIQHNILTEEMMVEALRRLRERLAARAKTAGSDLRQLRDQSAALKKELDRLIKTCARFDDPPEEVTEAIASKSRERKQIEARIAAAEAAPGALDLESRRLEQEARGHLRDLRSLLKQTPEEARKAIELLMDGPITFEPDQDADGKPLYHLSGRIAVGGLLGVSISTSPRGFEPRLSA